MAQLCFRTQTENAARTMIVSGGRPYCYPAHVHPLGFTLLVSRWGGTSRWVRDAATEYRGGELQV